MQQRQIRLPKLCRHKSARLGYVTIHGKEHYFAGEWPDGQDEPPAAIAEQYTQLCGRLLLQQPSRLRYEPTLTVAELWARYDKECQTYYIHEVTGKRTSEYSNVKFACLLTVELFGKTRAAEFSPRCLRHVKTRMIELGWVKTTINGSISRIKRMFRWGVDEELVQAEVWQALCAVKGLRRKDKARVSKPVPAVTDEVLEQTIPRLPGTLGLLVQVHRLVGCRADEVCAMRPCELAPLPEAPDLWSFTPTSSKNGARYLVGPKAQELLRPLLEQAGAKEYLFKSRRRRGRGAWSTNSYRIAVLRTCGRYGIPAWTPLQVRHAAGQEARDSHPRGIEATQARLDHEHVKTSQIYASSRLKLQIDVARTLG